MEKVTGIGGVFFRSKDPAELVRWYAENLGIEDAADGCAPWQQEAGPTVFAPFPHDTKYFGRTKQQFMVNFRVRDLDAMVEQLSAAGAVVDEARETLEGIGKFAWVADPEGNRFELWEPAGETASEPPGG